MADKSECDDLLAFLKEFTDQVCEIVRRDTKRIAAARVPSATRA
jgi:hypothetical protein